MVHEIQSGINKKATSLVYLLLKYRLNPILKASVSEYIKKNIVDWMEFNEIIQRERIAPLIYSIIRDQKIIPEFLERQYKLLYFRNAIRNKVLLKELEEILHVFEENEIPVIVLKGAALLETVYKNIALRKMSDIDLLIKKKDSLLAFKLLSSLGFNAEEERFPGQALHYEKELHFQKPGIESINVDLHWHLLNPNYYKKQLPLDWFWQSAWQSDTENLSASIFCPEAQILYLCGHLWLSTHAIDPNLLWVNDIVTLIYTYEKEIDWPLVLNKAQECKLVYSVQYTMNILVNQWDAPVPPFALARLLLMDPTPAEKEIFGTYVTISDAVSQKVWVKLSDIPSWRERLSIGIRYLFPSPAYLRYRYGISNSLALPFLYLHRIWLGIITVIQVAISHLPSFRH